MNLRKRIHEIKRRAGIAIVAVTHTRAGHLRLTLPCGRFVVASSTPSCPFAIRHIVGDIRRAQQQGNKHHAQ